MEEDKISSELYAEFDYISKSKPQIDQNNVVSKFTFHYPPPPPEKDSDGDLQVCRKAQVGFLEIEHSKCTGLDLVGLQIWRGALLLADWLMYNGGNFPKNCRILEMGSGVGLSSIVAAMFAPVLCTDINKGGLLNLIKSNILRNKHLTKCPIKVAEFDFTAETIPKEISESLPEISIIIAADVIYDNEITEAFTRKIKEILEKPPKRSIIVALEKRYVFTIADCDSIAPCYEFFIECLGNLRKEQIPVDFPQYFQYERVKELVLWRITSNFD